MKSAEFYKERLLEHYNHPRHTERLSKVDFASEEFNHSCGDQVHIEGSIKDGKIEKVAFTGSGCVVSQAAASMLMEECIGKTIFEVIGYDRYFIEHLIGVPMGPTRLRCAMLALYALQHGLKKYQDEQENRK